MSERRTLSTAPDGRSVIEDLTYAERRALPAVYHQPAWDGLGEPNAWLCSVCWDDGLSTGWPCDAAKGRDAWTIAAHAGLEWSR